MLASFNPLTAQTGLNDASKCDRLQFSPKARVIVYFEMNVGLIFGSSERGLKTITLELLQMRDFCKRNIAEVSQNTLQ